MEGARHGMCELTRHGMAWQGNGMGTAWARHGMCELALTLICRNITPQIYLTNPTILTTFYLNVGHPTVHYVYNSTQLFKEQISLLS
jgi:hypothetical protein